MKIVGISCLSFIILCFSLPKPELTFAVENKKDFYITGIQNEQTHAIAKRVIEVAYQKMGYKVRFQLFPGHRSIVMTNNGESDGDIARIKGTDKKYTDLVVVPTPVIEFHGVVFTKTITKEINDWSELKGLRIGIIRGIRYSEIGTRGLSPLFAEDMTHLFKLLDQERIQVAIATSKAGQIEVSKNFKKSSIHTIGRHLYSGPLYHFVHKRNQAIVTPLNTILQEMEKRGEIKKIVKTTFEFLLKE